ncbi:uncharacterized protein LOC114281329 [Camellia sinensis]|uniref:uncharacterized protein LOC114281329 n=1 Tax=Camellia sinensis TaxID=4442 RepID=UPI0010361487|nr:uncharacterized protein LOC114281329 [Camellia sinensis]
MDEVLNPTAINNYLSSIEALSGTNFKKWNEQIGIVLRIMDLDYALREPAPTKPNDTSSKEHMALYEKWKRSNRLSLMIIKGSIMPAIQGAIPASESAMSDMKSIEEQFIGTSKSLASTLMIKMMTMKYDGLSGVCELILKMNGMAFQLKGMDMEISEGFLVHFIMTSLHAQFGPFKINYNMQKDKWKMSELIAMCVQEEERLKAEKPNMAHLITLGPTKKIFKKSKNVPPNSWYTYVYLIREKSEALDMFKLYKAEVENQLGRRIKSVRSDRGGEYYGRFT